MKKQQFLVSYVLTVPKQTELDNPTNEEVAFEIQSWWEDLRCQVTQIVVEEFEPYGIEDEYNLGLVPREN